VECGAKAKMRSIAGAELGETKNSNVERNENIARGRKWVHHNNLCVPSQSRGY
jgi:hypothetical protein